MTDETEIRAQLRAFLHHYHPAVALRDNEDIFAAGFVTSLMALELVEFLESGLHLQITDGDLHMDNFRSIDALTALVVRHAGSA